MFNFVQAQIEFIRMGINTAELTPIVGQDSTDRQVMRLVEGQDVVVHNQSRGFGLFAGVEVTKGVAAEGVDYGVEIDLPHSFEATDVESILAQQLARPAALDVSLSEGRIGLLDPGDLLWGELDFLLDGSRFQLQQPVVSTPHAVLVEDTLNGWRADTDAFQLQSVMQPVAAASGVIDTQRQQLLNNLGWCGLGMVWWMGGKSLRPTSPCV